MNRPSPACNVCGCSDELRCSPCCAWNRPGLCTSCAGLGITVEACKACGRPVVWCTTINRKKMPVDPRPPAGIRVDQVISAGQNGPMVRHAHPEFIALQLTAGGPYRAGVSHFTNCPKADALRHRRQRRP